MCIPEQIRVKYGQLDNFIFPILEIVCNPRGLNDAGEFFEAHCPNCKQRLNACDLSMSANAVVTGIGQSASGCPHCGASTLVATLKGVTTEEMRSLQEDRFFSKILNTQCPQISQAVGDIGGSESRLTATAFNRNLDAGWNVLERDDYGFRITYPKDWFLIYTDQGIEILPSGNPVVFDLELACNVANPGVNITIKQVPENNEDNQVAQFVEILPASYKKMNKSYKQISSFPCNTPNATYGVYYEFQYSVGRTMFNCLSLVVQREKFFYCLTAPGSSSDYQKWRNTLTNILDSFELLD